MEINKHYQQYMVAFLDIIGFQDWIDGSIKNTHEVNNIYNTLIQIRNNADVLRKISKLPNPVDLNKLQILAFSDTIIITCPFENQIDDYFHNMSFMVMLNQIYLIAQNSFIRGAITTGSCLHEDNVIFGPAYVDAYQTEKFANWPRVVIHPDVIKDLSKNFLSSFKKSYLLQDDSGIWFLDYLTCMWILWSQNPKISMFKPLADMYLTHRNAIKRAVASEKVDKDLNLLTKYSACARYHNNAIDRVCKHFLGTKYVRITEKYNTNSKLQSYKIAGKDSFPRLYS